jgi:predicted NAD/FAD-dependent oxidoreductase
MTNNELALAFAKEVMGWEDAILGPFGGISKKEYDDYGSDYFTALIGDILDAVEAWCEEHKFSQIVYKHPMQEYVVEIRHNNIIQDMWSAISSKPDLSTALMTACLEAERKRRNQ